MKCQVLLCGTIALALTGECKSVRAQGEGKVHAVSKDGLTLQGKVEKDDPKVKVIVGNKFWQLPAKLFLVKLSSGKKYRISMDSKEIDSGLVVQDKTGRQLAWDDDGGGGLNSLLTLDVLKDDTYKIYAASFKGEGNFTLNVREDGAVKVYEVGAGLKINGELGKISAITYNVKLAAGKTYVINMISPDPNALDPFLRLLDADGKQLAEDDGGGEGQNARLFHQVQSAGTFQVVATSFGKGRGPYTLTVREGQDELAAQTTRWGAGHWRVTDIRLGLADVELFAKMSPKQRALAAKAAPLIDRAGLYHSQGNYAKAEPLYRQALEIRKAVLGENHPDYATSLNNLAYFYYLQGNYAKAEPLCRQALEITKAVLGEKHPNYATSLNTLAILYISQGNYAKAEPLCRQALEITKAVLGEKHPNYAASLNNLAHVYESQGNYAKAEPLYRQALEIRKAVLGEKHPDFAQSLNNLAYLYNLQGNYAKAEPLHRQALEIRKAVLGEKHPDYATSLNNLAYLYNSQGNYAKAEPLFRQALDIRKAALGEKHPAFARSLNNLAHVYESQGNYAKAEPLYRQALEIRKEVLGEKHPDYAQSLNSLTLLYEAQGNYAKAEPMIRQALEIWKAALGDKHPDYAQRLNDLARLYESRGNYAKAEPLYRQALEINKAALGEKHRHYAQSLNNLAVLYHSQGNYAKAEPLVRLALEIRKAVLGEKHPDYAASLNNLALLYNSQGNYAKAEPLHRQALEIAKEVLGEKHRDYAASLNNLAGLYKSQGNYAKAEPLHRQALEIVKEVLGDKHPAYATSLNNLARLYDTQGNYAKAEPLYHQALEIRKAVLGEKHPDYAQSLNNLAILYQAQGNYAKAEPLFRQALEIRKAVLGERHPDYAQSLNNLAILYQAQGNYAMAEPLFRQALVASQIAKNLVPFEQLQTDDFRIHPHTVCYLQNHALCTWKLAETNAAPERFRSCDRSFLLGLSVLDRVRQENLDQEESKIQMTGEWFRLVPNRIKVLNALFGLEKKPEDLEAAFWTAEQGTARAFLESLGKSRANFLAGVSAKHQTEEMDLLQDIRLLDLRLDKESARALDKRNPDLIGQLFNERREAEGKLKQLIGQLRKDYPQYAGLKYPRPCTLQQARGCLKDDEIALLFVPGTEESFLVLVEARPKPDNKTNGVAIYELPGSAELAGQVAALNDLETLALPARVKALGRQAYDTLLGPCKDRIKGKNLVIVPNGSLGLLPFEMLVEEDGKYLIENHRIRYAPSLTALHFINLWKQKRPAPTEPFFAVGDPVYDGGDERVANPKKVQVASTSRDGLRELLWREGKRDDFKRLIHSGKEVAKIAEFFGAKDDYVLTGENASEAKIKETSTANKMAKARYVHFATHGILGVDKGKQPALVLNLVGNKTEDGFLELSEIANLKLNADLVVLSACRTGQGRMARGEGVTGLARAFLYAGSKGVVCSLWSVDDQETSNLMVDFYQQLQKGQSAPEALRAAQLTMIRAGKAPLYWAPFIVIGE
jgi:tetratricopeptide (TPR) repeat protein/CHAT domain-containing protein